MPADECGQEGGPDSFFLFKELRDEGDDDGRK
jgi:hypothetical protein